ncbi:MAG: hypothetical protein WDO15_11195 [Bacteroidota bacterium]
MRWPARSRRVESAVSIVPPSWFFLKSVVMYQGKKIKVPHQYAGKDFFKVFTTNVIRGNASLSEEVWCVGVGGSC